MKKLVQAREYLKELKVDGWLLYDFHGNNELARYFLDIPSHQMTTRRFFYWIPTRGVPVKIVHAVEAQALDHFPGEKRTYFSWQSLENEVKSTLKGVKKVAMEYSPKNAIPYVSKVDGGTLEFIRSLGIEVVSSADFLAQFTAVLTEDLIQSHIRAATTCHKIVNETWKWIADQMKQGKPLTEYDIQQKISADFKKNGLITDHPAIIGINQNSADPHYEPDKDKSLSIRKGDFILIDLWAKEKEGIYGDIARVGVAAPHPTARQKEIFAIVRKAQKAAIELVKSRFAHKKRLEGWEVDEAARQVIRETGYGEFFLHRTGHNIGFSDHGSGANMDNLEMHDVRPILPGTCFSIEPGIYLPGEFGVRLESDVLIHRDGTVEITGGEQDSIVTLF